MSEPPRAAELLRHAAWSLVVLGCASFSAASQELGKDFERFVEIRHAEIAAAARPSSLAWSNPLRDGPVDVVFVMPSSAEVDYRMLVHHVHMSSRFVASESIGELLQVLDEPPAVIVVGNVPADAFSSEIVNGLIAAMRQGTGLVTVRYGQALPDRIDAFTRRLSRADDAAVLRGLGAPEVPHWHADVEFTRLFAGGKARMADIEYGVVAPLNHALIPAGDASVALPETFYDTYLALIARAILWTAKREPAVAIVGLEDRSPPGPDPVTTPPQLPGPFIQRMRDAAMTQPMRPYELRLSAPAPRAYEVQVRARYPYRNIAWNFTAQREIAKGARSVVLDIPLGHGLMFIDVWIKDRDRIVDWFTQAVRLEGWPQMTGVRYSTYRVRPSDSVTVTADVRRHYYRPRTSLLLLRATDTLGRVVAERYLQVDPEAGPVEATLNFTDVLTRLLKLEVFAADSAMPPLTQRQIEKADYDFAYLVVDQPHRRDFSFAVEGTGVPEFGTQQFNRALRLLGVDTFHTAPEVQGGVGLLLGDIDAIAHIPIPGAADISEARLALSSSARPTLARYPSVVALTGERPLDESLGLRRDLQGLAEGASVGYCMFDGRETPLWDWFRIASEATYLGVPYDERIFDALRSFGGDDLHAIVRVAAGDTRHGVSWRLWHAALNGMRGLWFSSPLDARLSGGPADSIDPNTQALLAVAHEIDRMRAGPLALLGRSEAMHSGVGVLVTRPAGDAEADRLHLQSVERVTDFLDALGYAYRLVAAEINGAQAIEDLSVVILPAVPALNAEEEKFVDAFLAWGGTVLADVVPGRAQHDAFANRIFGVRVGPTAEWSELVRMNRPRVDEAAAALPEIRVDVSVRANGARPAAMAGLRPMWLVWPSGPGRAILLNHPFEALEGERVFRDQFAAWLADAGAEPVLRPVEFDAEGFRGEVFAFRYSKARILALLSAYDDPEQRQRAVMRFEDSAFVYDLVSRDRYSGGVRDFRIERGIPMLLAILPYEVSRLAIEAPRQIERGRRLPVRIDVRTRGDLPGDHLVRLSIAPRGKSELRHYTTFVKCAGGRGESYIPLALNESRGAYTLKLEDVFSGVTEELELTIY